MLDVVSVNLFLAYYNLKRRLENKRARRRNQEKIPVSYDIILWFSSIAYLEEYINQNRYVYIILTISF